MSIPSGEKLYEYRATITGLTEFGASLEAIASGQAAPPPEGARIDASWAGTSTGPRLRGTVAGIDYLSIRGDGRIQLHLHAVITADTGETLAFFADGVALPRPGSTIADVRENVNLHTSHAAYRWVNGLQIWATGTVDLATREIHVQGFVA